MAQKTQIIIEEYYPEDRIIEGRKIDPDQKTVRFKEKGLKVDEFKKLIRKKFGDDVDIVNKVKKNRDVAPPVGREFVDQQEPGASDDGVSRRDIVEMMKNKYSD